MKGYSNAFYVLSEIKNPIQTVKRAAPLAMLLVSFLCKFFPNWLLPFLTLRRRPPRQHCILRRRAEGDDSELEAPARCRVFRRNVVRSPSRAGLIQPNAPLHSGPSANRAVSVIIALSAIGNVLSVLFSQGRVNQELGREGILPFSKFFASNRPFNSPFAGLALQWAVTLVIILAPPGGDAYSFLLSAFSVRSL